MDFKKVIKTIEEAQKTPINRVEAVELIKKHSRDEYENINDVWELAKKTGSQLHGELNDLKQWYIKMS